MQEEKELKKGVYLGAYKAYHECYNIDYNDIKKTSEHINIIKDMKEINLNNYDYIIATPPCNYYSRANYRRDKSDYAQKTKKLLPYCLIECARSKKPFIIENVRNKKIFEKENIYKICNDNGILIYELGRHTYFTNIFIEIRNIKQNEDNINNIAKTKRQGGTNVYNVIEWWLKCINARKK